MQRRADRACGRVAAGSPTVGAVPDVDLAALADAGAFVSHEHQDLIAARFGAGRPVVDPATGTVRFTDRDGGERRVRAHFIGTSSPTDGTWLWGWENINAFPDAFVRQARRMRAFGERHGIAELTTATLPLEPDLPVRLLRAVKTVTGVTAHLSSPTGIDDTRAWVLLDDPEFGLPEPTAVHAAGVITTALAGVPIADHRRALTAWAAQRDVPTEDRDGVVVIRLTDGVLRVRIDGDGRIGGVTTRLGPDADAPADPPAAVEVPSAAPAAATRAAPPRRRSMLDRLLGR